MKKVLLSALSVMICKMLLSSPLAGTYTVGTGGDFATLSAAVQAYNSEGVSAPVVFLLTDASYGPSETFPIIVNNGASETATLSIKPNTGVAVTITGTNFTGPLIDLSGADYVIIDGVGLGGSSLTISNTATGSSSSIRLTDDAEYNTITNCIILGSSTGGVGEASGNILFATGLLNGNDHNTISYCKIGPAGSNLPSKGICSTGTSSSSEICNSYNSIINCEIYDFFLPGNCSGIELSAGNTNWTITGNKIYETAARTFTNGGIFKGIYINTETHGSGMQVTNNTIGFSDNSGNGTLQLLGTDQAGAFVGISFVTSVSAAETSNFNSNTISNVSLESSSGVLYGIHNGGWALTNSININGNTISNLATTVTTGLMAGIYAGSAGTLHCDNNLITNISRTGLEKLTGIEVRECTDAYLLNNEISYLSANVSSGTSILLGITDDLNSRGFYTNGNIIHDFTTTSPDVFTIIGIDNAGWALGGNKTCSDNNIYNFTAPPATNLVGLYFYANSSPDPYEIKNNLVHDLSGGNIVYGIEQNGFESTNISNNKVYNLTGNSVSSLVSGIRTGNGTNILTNNIIGNLEAPSANSGLAVSGIYSGAASSLYFNTIFLNASPSSGTFGTAGVFQKQWTQLEMQNNAIINVSGFHGTGVTCALRREVNDFWNYSAASNHNLYYAGTPGAGNLLLLNAATPCQTIAELKAQFSSEANSLSGNLNWISTIGSSADYLHIDPLTGSYAESTGIPVEGYSSDFDNDSRNASTPDIGADEFSGISLDLAGPVITFSIPDFACTTGDMEITGVHITDETGIPDSSSNDAPRIYFQKNSEGWHSRKGTFVSGTPDDSYWDFKIRISDIGGDLASGDHLYYYITAQDVVSVPNVSSNPAEGFAATSVNTVVSHPSVPVDVRRYETLNGIYSVGTGGYFSTLTSAVDALNNGCIGGPVVFELINPLYEAGEDEGFPIVISDNPRGGDNPFTLRPAEGNDVVISGYGYRDAAIRITRSHVTIDGSNSEGSTRNLTVTNTMSDYAYGIIVGSAGNDTTEDVTIKNCVVYTVDNHTGAAISVSAADPDEAGITVGAPGKVRDVSIINNRILNSYFGIDISTENNPGIGTGIQITGNYISSEDSGSVRNTGIYLSGTNGCKVSSNVIKSIIADEGIDGPAGIYTDEETSYSVISGNTINGIFSYGTDEDALSNRPVGIYIATFSDSKDTISGNLISQIHTNGHYAPMGMVIIGSGVMAKNNQISDILSENNDPVTKCGSFGIVLYNDNPEDYTTVSNNMISGISAYGDDNVTGGNNGCGIWMVAGGNYSLYYNSINMAVDQANGGYPACLFISAGVNAPGSVDLINNIFSNSASSGTERYAVISGTDASVFGTIDHNDYFSSGENLCYLGGNITGLPGWQTATGQDTYSVSGDPQFVGSCDLHINPVASSPISNAGLNLGLTYSSDIDGDPRNSSTPDMGADEYDQVSSGLQWNGSVSSDWTDPQNWTPHCLPGASTTVSIVSGYVFEPNVNSTGILCGSLTIGAGTVMHVAENMDITISGDFIVEDGATLDNQGVITVEGNLVN